MVASPRRICYSSQRAMISNAFLFLGSLVIGANLSAAELTVHAAASLTDAMKEIGVAYEKENSDKLQFNFGASNTLARQIEEGVSADLFVSADEAKMDALEKKSLLLAGTRRSFLSNLLVMIVPAEVTNSPKSVSDLVRPEFKKIALAEPETVPAGIYSRQYLQKLGLWEALKQKVVPMENVRAALSAVESGNVEAGFVYKTDALISKKAKISAEISAAEGPRISYPLAVLAGSKEREAAKQFAAYLASPPAQKVFEKFGFVVVP